MRQLCVAAASYADTFGVLPSAANGGSYTFDASGNRVYTYGQRFFTFVPLLPYLETKETYQKICWDQSPYQDENSQNREVMREQLEMLSCPSDLWEGYVGGYHFDGGWTNYVVNTGTWCGLRRQQPTLALLPKPIHRPKETATVHQNAARIPYQEMTAEALAPHFDDANDASCINSAIDTASDETERGNSAVERENTERKNVAWDGVWAADWDGVFGYDQDLWMPEYLPPIRSRACPAIRWDDITDGTSNTMIFSEAIVGSDYGERHERHLETGDSGRGDCFGGPWVRTATATDPDAVMRVRRSWLSSSRQILNADMTLRYDAPTALWK